MKAIFLKTITKEDVSEFHINCSACFGLCCVSLYFSKLDGFPQDKKAGIPCENLCDHYTCCIHEQLERSGLKGCMAYDCFGAGPVISKKVQGTPNWKNMNQHEAQILFDAFTKMTSLYQTLWYLKLSMYLNDALSYQTKIKALLEEGTSISQMNIKEFSRFDITSFQMNSNQILKAITTTIANLKIAKVPMLISANLSKQNMNFRDFSMCCMIGANLSQASVYGANFLGADMRDVNVQDCDLQNSLYLTQIQLNAMKGNQNTKLPEYLTRPTNWR